MRTDIRRKGKMKKMTKFAKRMKKSSERSWGSIEKSLEEDETTSRQGKKRNWEIEKKNRVMLSTKNLLFKERLVRKLVDWYVGPYFIDKVVSTNTVKL